MLKEKQRRPQLQRGSVRGHRLDCHPVKPKQQKIVLWSLFAVVVIVGLISFLRKDATEMPVYMTGSARMLAGEEVFRPGDDKPFSYPPFAAVPTIPVAVLPEAMQRTAWYFLNIGILVLVVRLLWSVLRGVVPEERRSLPAGRGLWLFWILVILIAGRHVAAVLQNQSHDFIILLCLTLSASTWGKGREWLAGIFAGLGGAFKATPLLFAVPFAVTRRLPLLIGLGVGFLAASLLPDLLFPRTDGRFWLVAWYEIMVSGVGVGEVAERQGVWSAHSWLNQSLSGALYRLTTPTDIVSDFQRNAALVTLSPEMRKALTMISQLAVIGLIAFVSFLPTLKRFAIQRSPREQAFRRLGETALVACGMVLLSPMSSKSHFCVLLLPVAYCLCDFLFRKKDPILGLLLLAAFVVGTLSSRGVVGSDFAGVLLSYGTVTWATALLLLATAHALFWRDTTLKPEPCRGNM